MVFELLLWLLRMSASHSGSWMSGSASLFLKGQLVIMLAFVDQIVSVATSELCPCRVQAAVDDM